MSIELLAQMSLLDFFWGCSILFHRSCCISQFSSVVHKSANFSTSSPKLFFFFLNESYPNWYEMISPCDLSHVNCSHHTDTKQTTINNQQRDTRGHIWRWPTDPVSWLWRWCSENTHTEKLLKLHVLNMCTFCISLMPQWSWEKLFKRLTNVCFFNDWNKNGTCLGCKYITK